ncbi:hypothetical protein AB0I15_66420, partial [Nonomuraea sp. NPDC050643]
MGTVRRLSPRSGVPGLGVAVEAFLATIGNRNTKRAYAIALRTDGTVSPRTVAAFGKVEESGAVLVFVTG